MKNIEIIEPKLRGNAYSASRHMFAAIYAETVLTQNQCIVILPLSGGPADDAVPQIGAAARRFNTANWSTGSFFRGHYQVEKVSYSSKSLSIRFTGVAPEQMTKLAMEVCRELGQTQCLLKRPSPGQADRGKE